MAIELREYGYLQCRMGVPMAMGRRKAQLVLRPEAARTARRPGQFAISSGGARESGKDYFAECFWEDEHANCAPAGADQGHGRQVAAALLGAGCVRAA